LSQDQVTWMASETGRGILDPDSEDQSNTQGKPRKKNTRRTRKKALFSVLRALFLRGCKGAKIEPQVHPLIRLYPVGYDCIINPTSESRLDANTGIGLIEAKDRRVGKLHITALYADVEGKILGSDWKTVEGLLNEQTYNQIMKEGISQLCTDLAQKCKTNIQCTIIATPHRYH
jgi:hypothetical protein